MRSGLSARIASRSGSCSVPTVLTAANPDPRYLGIVGLSVPTVAPTGVSPSVNMVSSLSWSRTTTRCGLSGTLVSPIACLMVLVGPLGASPPGGVVPVPHAPRVSTAASTIAILRMLFLSSAPAAHEQPDQVRPAESGGQHPDRELGGRERGPRHGVGD